ncbi:DUF397 domain-containing protein [Streptomyces sp. NPDC005805]|uniref:DUF397 domain-containing protein n=1 Tax=Streptomyces sp. NPDC005805 TaxID=3157068 RepID=UPI0033F59C02
MNKAPHPADHLHWFKSSYSNGSGGECVETARWASAILVRDSKLPKAGRLMFSSSAWGVFVARVSTLPQC